MLSNKYKNTNNYLLMIKIKHIIEETHSTHNYIIICSGIER